MVIRAFIEPTFTLKEIEKLIYDNLGYTKVAASLASRFQEENQRKRNEENTREC